MSRLARMIRAGAPSPLACAAVAALACFANARPAAAEEAGAIGPVGAGLLAPLPGESPLNASDIPAHGLPNTVTPTLAPTGPRVNVGDLGLVQDRAGRLTGQVLEGWAITPSIGATEYYNSNLGGGGRTQGGDFVTTISPAVLVNGNTERIQANLFYSPTGLIYARTGQNDGVDQALNGQAHLTLARELLFLDLRGFASVTATNGGFGPTGSPVLNRQNQTQTYSFAVSPYLRHRFNDTGTGEIGYTYAYTDLNDYASTTLLPQASALFGVLSTNTEHAAFRTGDRFGRINGLVFLQAEQENGPGVLRDAHHNLGTLDLAYALNRSVALLGEGGYEDIAYSSLPPIRIKDAVWYGGLRLTPNEDTLVTLRYGHQGGFNAPYVDAGYALTARTRIYARYSDTLTTQEEQIQDTLATTSVDSLGDSLDSGTGAPLQVTNNFFGLQGGVYRHKAFSASAVTVLGRNSITLGVQQQQDNVIGTAPGVPANNSHGVTGSIAWTHQITDALASTVYAQYGSVTPSIVAVPGANQASREEAVFTFDAGATYKFTPTLSGVAQYIISHNGAAFGQQTILQNIVLVGLRKTF